MCSPFLPGSQPPQRFLESHFLPRSSSLAKVGFSSPGTDCTRAKIPRLPPGTEALRDKAAQGAPGSLLGFRRGDQNISAQHRVTRAGSGYSELGNHLCLEKREGRNILLLLLGRAARQKAPRGPILPARAPLPPSQGSAGFPREEGRRGSALSFSSQVNT